jgi:hypothetical protein
MGGMNVSVRFPSAIDPDGSLPAARKRKRMDDAVIAQRADFEVFVRRGYGSGLPFG